MSKTRRKRSIIWTIPKEEFELLVKNSNSIADICRKLGFSVTGKCHKTIKQRIKHDGINYSHITLGLNNNKGKKRPSKLKIPLSEILVRDSNYSRKNLKKRLLEEKIIEEKCECCGSLPIWHNKRLVLVLDHINGKNNDNRKENLRLLCPNCNSQQSTFSGRNRKNHKKVKPTLKKCSHCNTMMVNSKTCGACNAKINYRKFNPSKEELEKLVHQKPFTKIAGLYDVSDNAVRKRCKLLGINIPKYPPGYWLKKLQS